MMIRRAQSLHFPTNHCAKQKRKLSFETTQKFLETLRRKSTSIDEVFGEMDPQITETPEQEPRCTCGLLYNDDLQCTCGIIAATTNGTGSGAEVDLWTDYQLQKCMQVDSLEDITDGNRKGSLDDNKLGGYDKCSDKASSLSGSVDSQNKPTSPSSEKSSSKSQKSKLPVMTKSPEPAPSPTDSLESAHDVKNKGKTIIKYKTIDLSNIKPKIQSLPVNKCKGVQSPTKRNDVEQNVPSPVAMTANESHGIRETVTSRMRFEKKHAAHEIPDCEGESYLTPTQRNEQQVKYMRKEIKELRFEIEEKNNEIEVLKSKINKGELKVFEDKEKEVKDILMEVQSLRNENDKLRKSYAESVKTINILEETIRNLKETMEENEKKSEALYLEMYRKGQETARFERDEEIERLAACSTKKSDKSKVTMNELIDKLNSTETELAKWQTFRRRESYEMAEKPETQADAILKFLKDSFFHYLTDVKDSENHLRAMVRIFSYTDVQKKKIADALTPDRKIKS